MTRAKERWAKLTRTLQFHHLRVVHRSRDPHLAALSFSLGVFLGLMPISMLATILAIFLPRRMGLRVVPAVVGTFAGNWLTAPFILSAAMVTGRFLTTGHFSGFEEFVPPAHLKALETLHFFMHLGWSFFLGISIVSFLGALAGYTAVYFSVTGAMRLRKARILERMHLRDRLHLSPQSPSDRDPTERHEPPG